MSVSKGRERNPEEEVRHVQARAGGEDRLGRRRSEPREPDEGHGDARRLLPQDLLLDVGLCGESGIQFFAVVRSMLQTGLTAVTV